MATELVLSGATAGSTIYAILRRDSDEKVWSTVASAYVTFANADYANYDVVLTETPSNSRYWYASLPIGAEGVEINVNYYQQVGGSPSITNDLLLGGERISIEGTVSTTSTTNLITQAEYEAVVDTDASDDKLQFLIASATQAIFNYCGFVYTQETITEYLNGSGFNFLQLKARPLSLTAVTKDPEDNSPLVHSVTDFSWSEKGLLYFKPTANANAFDIGFRNWKVEYTSYGVVPADLKQACILVVQAMELNTASDQLISEKVVDGVKIRYDIGFIDIANPLFGQARELLAPYRTFLCI